MSKKRPKTLKLEFVGGPFFDFLGYFRGLFGRPPKRPFLRLFGDFGPGDSCKWRLESQSTTLFAFTLAMLFGDGYVLFDSLKLLGIVFYDGACSGLVSAPANTIMQQDNKATPGRSLNLVAFQTQTQNRPRFTYAISKAFWNAVPQIAWPLSFGATKSQRFKSQRLQDANAIKSQTLAFSKSQRFSATNALNPYILNHGEKVKSIAFGGS